MSIWLGLRLRPDDGDSVLAAIRGVARGERAGGSVPAGHRLTVRGPAGEERLQFKHGVVRTQLAAMEVCGGAGRRFTVAEPQLNHRRGLLSSSKLSNRENKGVKNKTLQVSSA